MSGETLQDVIAMLRVAVSEYDETMQAIGGCGDNSCNVYHRGGMGTNGGCRCSRDEAKARRVMVAAARLRKALA